MTLYLLYVRPPNPLVVKYLIREGIDLTTIHESTISEIKPTLISSIIEDRLILVKLMKGPKSSKLSNLTLKMLNQVI